jgi:integrase
MPRKSGIWPRNTPAGVVYYSKIRGRQIRLSADRAEAESKLARLLGGGPADLSRADEVCDEYLEYVHGNKSPEVYDRQRRLLRSFCRRYGSVPVVELRRRHVTQWLKDCQTWNSSTRAHAGVILQGCFAWAVEEGLVAANPFRAVKKTGELHRERVLTPEEWARLLAAAREPFRTYLRGLRLSGCRPGEIRAVTDEMVDLEHGRWVLPKHKTRGKTGVPRVVWLCPELLELTRELMKRGPGFLFRNSRGRGWTETATTKAFEVVRERAGLGRDVFMYSIRHTFATEAVGRCDLATVAELLGHKSVNTTLRHYVHLQGRGDLMREAARQAVAGINGCAGDGVGSVGSERGGDG